MSGFKIGDHVCIVASEVIAGEIYPYVERINYTEKSVAICLYPSFMMHIVGNSMLLSNLLLEVNYNHIDDELVRRIEQRIGTFIEIELEEEHNRVLFYLPGGKTTERELIFMCNNVVSASAQSTHKILYNTFLSESAILNGLNTRFKLFTAEYLASYLQGTIVKFVERVSEDTFKGLAIENSEGFSSVDFAYDNKHLPSQDIGIDKQIKVLTTKRLYAKVYDENNFEYLYLPVMLLN